MNFNCHPDHIEEWPTHRYTRPPLCENIRVPCNVQFLSQKTDEQKETNRPDYKILNFPFKQELNLKKNHIPHASLIIKTVTGDCIITYIADEEIFPCVVCCTI